MPVLREPEICPEDILPVLPDEVRAGCFWLVLGLREGLPGLFRVWTEGRAELPERFALPV